MIGAKGPPAGQVRTAPRWCAHQLAEREAKRRRPESDANRSRRARAKAKHAEASENSAGLARRANANTLSRAERNAESQAAALKGIAERMKAKGDKHGANMITAKAASIRRSPRQTTGAKMTDRQTRALSPSHASTSTA